MEIQRDRKHVIHTHDLEKIKEKENKDRWAMTLERRRRDI
jgi:hypothetical protein